MVTSQDIISRLLAKNEKYAKSFPFKRTMGQMQVIAKSKDKIPVSVRKYTLLAIAPISN